jgi:predicted ABC-type ATPase
MAANQPILYIIGGPNGAGKTTVALSIMPEMIECYEYVNADAIAKALSPFKSDEVSIEAGRVMLKRIKELAARKEDFAFETTMASRSFVPFLHQCKNNGYQIHSVYVWLHSPELSIARIEDRVLNGGHFVPDEVVRTRYRKGLENFLKLYIPVSDSWSFYDNSQSEIKLIAEKPRDSETEIKIKDSTIWKLVLEALQ